MSIVKFNKFQKFQPSTTAHLYYKPLKVRTTGGRGERIINFEYSLNRMGSISPDPYHLPFPTPTTSATLHDLSTRLLQAVEDLQDPGVPPLRNTHRAAARCAQSLCRCPSGNFGARKVYGRVTNSGSDTLTSIRELRSLLHAAAEALSIWQEMQQTKPYDEHATFPISWLPLPRSYVIAKDGWTCSTFSLCSWSHQQPVSLWPTPDESLPLSCVP